MSLTLRIRSAICWTFATASMFSSAPSLAAAADCSSVAFSSGRCALYVDGSGSAGSTASLGPELRSGSAFPVSLTGGFSEMGSSSRFEISGVATFGALTNVISVVAGTTGATGAPHASAVANLNLYFSDRLTFTDPTLARGTLGTAYGRIGVTGGVGASPATYPATTAQASAQVVTNGASVSVQAYGDRAGTGGIPAVITFAIPISFNNADFSSLNVQLGTGAMAAALNGPGSIFAASANANFTTGVEWLGIERVVDANGITLNGWSVQSASGFDYAQSYAVQAVPEPQSAVMLLLGMLVVLRFGRAAKA